MKIVELIKRIVLGKEWSDEEFLYGKQKVESVQGLDVKQYQEIPKCSKCGFSSIKTKYIGVGQYHNSDFFEWTGNLYDNCQEKREHLHRRCCNCGYSWIELY